MIKSNSDFQHIIELFENRNNFLLTSHQDPDGDSIGTLVGLYKFLKGFGKNVIAYSQGRLPNKYTFLDSKHIINFDSTPPPFAPENVIILECPEIERIGFVQEFIEDGMTIVNIDHHPKNREYGDIYYIDESASAVAEIIFEIIKTNGHSISPEIAEAFYAAIASDTGRFKFTNTTARCFNTVAELVTAGANPRLISQKIFSSFSAGTIRLLGHLLKTIQLFDNGRICVLKLTLDDLKKYDVRVEDTEGIIDYSLVIENVKVGVLFKERVDQAVKVGLRSQNGINIGKYAVLKGGGGHDNAAGFTVNMPIDEAIETVVKEIAGFLDD